MQRAHNVAIGNSGRRMLRAGEMDAKTIIIMVVAGIGGLAFLACAGVAVFVFSAVPRMQVAVQQARSAAQNTMSRNNLKQIGLALHNYHDVVQSFPPGGIYAEDGTPHHSWQTMLLPYVDQAALYNVIDFHRPWTDPANVDTFSIVIPTFVNPADSQNSTATGGAASHYAANQHIMFANSSLRIRDVTDGTSNTMLAGEVADGYKAWGDPSNIRDPADGILRDANTFGSPEDPSKCTILMMDGSAREISSDISTDVLKALSTPDGGEELPTDF